VLEYAYTKTSDGRVVLKLKPSIAPYQVAVFPLVAGKKPEHARIVSIAKQIYRELVKRKINAYYDEEGSIGRRYVRADEIGIPYAITIDYQTLEDGTVTVRDRDTREQVRVHISELYGKLLELLGLKTTISIKV